MNLRRIQPTSDLLTWVGEDEEARAAKMTVPGVASVGLVVEVHGDGGVVDERVRNVAWATLLQYPAIYVRLRAREVNVVEQRVVVRRWPSNAPHRMPCILFVSPEREGCQFNGF